MSVGQEGMSKDRRRWLRLQYLLAIAKAQNSHMEYMRVASGDTISAQLLQGSIRQLIQTTRDEIRASPLNKRLRDREEALAKRRINKLFDRDNTRRTMISVRFGDEVEVNKYPGHFAVTVRYMWNRKVWSEIYKLGMASDLKQWLILSAEKVRVNSKYLDLYEVKAMDINSAELVDGYVSITKTEKRRKAFGKTAQQAIKRGEAMLSGQLDAMFIG